MERMGSQLDRSLVASFIEAACKPERARIRAITGSCGLMVLFWKELAAVDALVFISGLVRIPWRITC